MVVVVGTGLVVVVGSGLEVGVECGDDGTVTGPPEPCGGPTREVGVDVGPGPVPVETEVCERTWELVRVVRRLGVDDRVAEDR